MQERKYFCIRIGLGDIFYPALVATDDPVVEVFYEAEDNGYKLVSGYVWTQNNVTVEMSEEDFNDQFRLPALKEQKLIQASDLRRAMYEEIEGYNNVNYVKAMTRAYSVSDFTEIDIYFFKKKQVKDGGDADEATINAFTSYADCLAYVPQAGYTANPPIEFTSITVGSFIDRFHADETRLINDLKRQSAQLTKMYDALTSRTHVNLKDAELNAVLSYLERESCLLTTPIDNTYTTRKEELMRPGTTKDAFRPSL